MSPRQSVLPLPIRSEAPTLCAPPVPWSCPCLRRLLRLGSGPARSESTRARACLAQVQSLDHRVPANSWHSPQLLQIFNRRFPFLHPYLLVRSADKPIVTEITCLLLRGSRQERGFNIVLNDG